MLSQNAISCIYNKKPFELNQNANEVLLQIIHIETKELDHTQQYRLILNDGTNYTSAIVHYHSNHIAGRLKKYNIIQCENYVINFVDHKKMIVLNSMKIIDVKPKHVLGNPINIASVGCDNDPPAYTVVDHSKIVGARPVPIDNDTHSNNGTTTTTVQNQQEDTLVYNPIASLNPYNPRWIIKGRVINKSEVKSWSNEKGSGTYFNFDFMDQHGTAIKVTAFRDLCEKYFNFIKLGECYTISRGQVAAKSKFNDLQFTYELKLDDKTSEVKKCKDDPKIGRELGSNFTPIDLIHKTKNEHDTVDVIGIIAYVNPELHNFTAKSGKTFNKREFMLVDQSRASMKFTSLGDFAAQLDVSDLGTTPVLEGKNIKVGIFENVKSVSTFGNNIRINPNTAEAHELIKWAKAEGASVIKEAAQAALREANMTSLKYGGVGMGGTNGSETAMGKGPAGTFGSLAKALEMEDPIPVSNIEATKKGFDGPEYFNVDAEVVLFENMTENTWYDSCPSEKCKKKVEKRPGTSIYYCEKCKKQYTECRPSYTLRIQFRDIANDQGIETFMCFNQESETILGGTKASVLKSLVETMEIDPNAREKYSSIFEDALRKRFRLRICAQPSSYRNEIRSKCQVIALKAYNNDTSASGLKDDEYGDITDVM
jgi:replication factor A1